MMIRGPKVSVADQVVLDKYASLKKNAISAQIDGQSGKITKEEANTTIKAYNDAITSEGVMATMWYVK